MTDLTKPGRLFFAVAMAAFGIQYLFHALAKGPVPGPPWVPGRPLWAYATAILLIVAGLSIATGKQACCGAIALAILLFVRALLLYAPKIVATPHDPRPWTSGFELLAMSGAALVIAAFAAGAGRILFAISLGVFGVQHFLYANFIATLIPGWIPAHLFWAYFVGAAFCAAALSIALRKYSGLAATMLGVMFLLWVISLHLPRVSAASHNGNEWTSAIVALA